MDILEQVRQAGVIGAGGAGFPTHIKLAASASLVIANGCECEPLLAADTWLLEHRAERVLAGLEIARKTVGAATGVIALKKKNRQASKAIEQALANYDKLELQLIDDFFPAGDEHILTQLVTGKIIPPGGIPLDVGIVVNNVATLFNIYQASSGIPVTDKIISVAGSVCSPLVTEAPVGTPLGALIQAAGGVKGLENIQQIDYTHITNTRAYQFVVLAGGSMMGEITTDLRLPLEKRTGGLLVLPDDHPLILKKTSKQDVSYSKIACCACDQCTVVCPRRQLGHPLYPHKLTKAFASKATSQALASAFLCCACGLCTYYACSMGVSPTAINKQIKKTRKKPETFPPLLQQPPPGKEERVSGKRLIQKLGLTAYQVKPIFKRWKTSRIVTLTLAQHYGAAAEACVKVGDTLNKGDLVARIPADKLGACLHASINGLVTRVTSRVVELQQQ